MQYFTQQLLRILQLEQIKNKNKFGTDLRITSKNNRGRHRRRGDWFPRQLHWLTSTYNSPGHQRRLNNIKLKAPSLIAIKQAMYTGVLTNQALLLHGGSINEERVPTFFPFPGTDLRITSSNNRGRH